MNVSHHVDNKCSSLHPGMVYFPQAAPQHQGALPLHHMPTNSGPVHKQYKEDKFQCSAPSTCINCNIGDNTKNHSQGSVISE